MDLTRLHVPPLWAACFWCLCTVVAVVRAACPDNAIEKAMMCTAGLGFGPPTTSNNAFVERIEMVKQACRDNKLTKAMDCLEEITGACQGSSDQEHYLRNMLDVNKERRLVAFFCSHLKEYEDQAPCIVRLQDNLTQCVLQQRQNMETKVKATNNMDYLMTSSCRYLHAAEICSQQVLSKACSPSAANMVAKLFTGFKPPLCHTVTYSSQDDDHNSAGMSGGARSRWSWMEVTIICVVLLCNWFQNWFSTIHH